MRIGIYLDLRNPPPWRRPWADLYARSLDLIAVAEAQGADSVWLSEHHFFEDGYLPQPLTFAAAVAARTARVRIGTAILIAPLRRAVQIAEEAAIVDLVSGGRLELGLGGGYRIPEFEAFGADVHRRFPVLDRQVVEVRALLDDNGVTPPPAQAHVPIWVGYFGAAGARRVGRTGEGLLALDPDLVAPYREGLAEGGHDPAAARMAGLVNVVVADDPDGAWARIGPHLAYQLHSYARYALDGTGVEVPEPPDPDVIRRTPTRPGQRGIFPQFAILTADETVEVLRERAAGVPAVEAFFWASIAGMPDDLAARHVELLCTRVRPAVAGL